MSKLILMVGESGSGKSTKAAQLLKQAQNEGRKCVRVNRDSIRTMLFGKDSSWDFKLQPCNENVVTKIEKDIAIEALVEKNKLNFDVIVDDINLSPKTQNKWQELAKNYNAEFEVVKMDTPFDVCVERDSQRAGRERVGRAVIERQFLSSGRANFGTKQIVLVDVDGTLANHEGIRSPFDETKVYLDRPYPVVVQWVKNLAPEYSVVIVSGRHASCGPDTIEWLHMNGITYDHILMRNGGDNRPDEIVKKEYLDGMYKCGVTKDQIAFVIDDRPKVVRMWKENGLTVYPVRGKIEEF